MRLVFAFLGFSAALMAAGGSYPVRYEGGSLPLNHRKVTARVDNGSVVFQQHGQRLEVPVQSITAISCGSDVHRRLKVTKSEKDYIGVSWIAESREVEALFKARGREYRDFLKALESSTGKKAVDAHKVPVVVHYESSPTTM